ncbi:LysR family transcriptional regulator [Clostridium sp. W14A]|nr:LysR family transcriptional regulator [Clostridium sp. W14A]
MTLKQLNYIIEVVARGSINEAANSLFISQPSLSKSIRDLETEFGIEIFNRSAKGISLTAEGSEFLCYARQVIEQTELLEQRYKNLKPSRQMCSISTQHYAFAVDAFVNLIQRSDSGEYEFTLRETRTHEILSDVRDLRSEIGILYLSPFNRKVLERFFQENHLLFHPLFQAGPHIFISKENPLAGRKEVFPSDLGEFPYLSFEQGEYNSFYFAEELQSITYHRKRIHVSDRATLFNLLIDLNGYTISSGVLSTALNGTNIVSVPLRIDDSMLIGWIENQKVKLSGQAKKYIAQLKLVIRQYGFDIVENYKQI